MMHYDECSCDCEYGGDGDMPEFIRISSPKAQKAHKCNECDGIIQPGQKYELVVGKWDGFLSVFKTCDACRRIRETYCSCSPYGCMRDDIWECMGFDYITGVVREEEDNA